MIGNDSEEAGCIPLNQPIVSKQARYMFFNWAKTHPEGLSLPPSVILHEVFLEAYGSCEELKGE